MPETQTGTREVQQLRRCIRDLVALSAFPAVWVGSDARRIAESLADVLRHMLHLDLIYLAVREGADGIAVEVAETAQGPAAASRAQEVGRALDPWLRLDSAEMPPSIADPFGGGTMPIVVTPFGLAASSGVLVAGSRRADFPNEFDRLLLHVGANQAAILLERRRAEEALRLANARLDLALHGSNIVIAELNMPGDDLQNGRWEWLSAGDQVGGYDRSEVGSHFANMIASLHPGDRERVLSR